MCYLPGRKRLAVVLESELGGRDVGSDPYTLSACRIAGVLKQFPDPPRTQRTAVVLDAVEVLEYSLRRVVYEHLVPGVPKFLGHLRFSRGRSCADTFVG